MGRNDQGLEIGRKRYKVVPRVLIFLRNELELLLLRGSPNKPIWANLYNGIGGHIEKGEDIYSAALREVQEESGLLVSDLELRAIANIDAGDKNTGIMIFVYCGWVDDKKTTSSIEGDLHWFPIQALPMNEMVEDLPWLLPNLLEKNPNQQPLYLHYHYDIDDNLIIRGLDCD